MTINTVRGADASAIIYSVTETARANGLNVYYYMKYKMGNVFGGFWKKHFSLIKEKSLLSDIAERSSNKSGVFKELSDVYSWFQNIIEVLRRGTQDTNSAPQQVLELLEEYIRLREQNDDDILEEISQQFMEINGRAKNVRLILLPPPLTPPPQKSPSPPQGTPLHSWLFSAFLPGGFRRQIS